MWLRYFLNYSEMIQDTPIITGITRVSIIIIIITVIIIIMVTILVESRIKCALSAYWTRTNIGFLRSSYLLIIRFLIRLN
jgi:hypothetical protein